MPTTPEQALTRFVAKFPSQVRAARALHISPAYLSDLLSGKRGFSPTMLAKLGLEPVTTFRKRRTA